MFSYRSCLISGLILRFLIHFELILCRVRDKDLLSFFYIWITLVLALFVKKVIFSPLHVFVKNQMTVCVGSSVSSIVPLVHVSVFMIVPCSFC